MPAKFRSRPDFRRLLAVVATVGLTLAGVAEATVRPNPVRVRLEGTPRAADANQPFTTVLEIEARADVRLEEVFLNTGRTWRLIEGEIPSVLELAAGEVRRIPVTVVGPDPTDPLHFEYQVGDRAIRRPIDLSPAAAADRRGRSLVAVTDPAMLAQLEAGIDATSPRPEANTPAGRAVHRDFESLGASESVDTAAPADERDIRVVGWFTYTRMDGGAAVGVDGATARVYDEDSSWDELLATQVLGPDGRLDVTFHWDPCFGCDGTPDIYVEFELDNARTQVQEDGIFEVDYTWETGVWNDFGGNFLDIGARMPSNGSQMPACHIMTNITRAWRFAANTGRDCPIVDVQWPDDNDCPTGCYNNFFEEIHIPSSRQWDENTIVHEYGHHFTKTFGSYTAPDYCNNFCDTNVAEEECGHCLWCRETDHDAWNEGFPYYFSDTVIRGYQSAYGRGPVTPRINFETLARCTQDNIFHTPGLTEGFLAAMLVDIDDSAQDNDPWGGFGIDELSLGFDEIFGIADGRAPNNPQDLINWFRMDYPGEKEKFWATALNNGFQTDFAPPGKVTNITSDHFLNAESTNPNIKWFWNRAPDDASGIAGYSIWVQRNIIPGMPDAVAEVNDVTQWTTGPHPPGWYWIAIRAQDRNGTWSNEYEIQGPYGIRVQEPANLRVQHPSNWSGLGVVPRHTADAGPFDCPAPTFLNGEGGLTWFNAIYNNAGEQATWVSQYWNSLYLDGYPFLFQHRITPLPAGSYDYMLNTPATITGGRHTLGVRIDDTDLMLEPDETDNQWAHQWSWSPAWIGLWPPAYYNSPPTHWAGTEWIVDGSFWTANCRGIRASDQIAYPNQMWSAVTLHATDGADYDMTANVASNDPNWAYTNTYASAFRGAYATDILLRNSWQGWGDYLWFDLAVTNYSGGVPGINGFYMQEVTSSTVAFNSTTLGTLGSQEMLKLYQFASPGGPVFARLQMADPSQGRLYLTMIPWLAPGFGTMVGAGTLAVTDATTGEAWISEPQDGFPCLAVWRDPTMGTGPVGFTLTIMTPPVDLAMATPAGWAAPLVPRPANDGTPGAVPAPALLVGDAAQTWVNYAFANNHGVPPNPVVTSNLYRDDVLILADPATTPGSGMTTYRNLSMPIGVPGGRHVLGIDVDPASQFPEISKTNNATAGQWVWQPAALPFDVTMSRSAPPARFAGWNRMPAGSPLWFNMDGVRTAAWTPEPGGFGWKVAALAMPNAGHDVDLALFEAAANATTGFDAELTSSAWGIDQADFVIADFRVTTPRQFDVGFTAPSVPAGGFSLEFRRSTYLGSGPAAPGLAVRTSFTTGLGPQTAAAGGSHGPFVFGEGQHFDLYEVDLPVGTYRISLVPGSGGIDWGIGLYPPGQDFTSRSDALPGGLAWEAPAGMTEGMNVTIAQPGLHTLVAWKNRPSDLGTTGTMTLVFDRQTTGVPDAERPLDRRLIQSIRPNPVTGPASVAIELPVATPVVLQVFDPRGRRVSRSEFASLSPGRHELTWDGRDDTGESVPAGIYFVRVVAGSRIDERKIVRVR
jgi:hypothetical protein